MKKCLHSGLLSIYHYFQNKRYLNDYNITENLVGLSKILPFRKCSQISIILIQIK